MKEYFVSTPPRSPTFFERMRLTCWLFWLGLPMPVVWLKVVWSSGAIVSSSPISQRSAKLVIETNGGNYLNLVISKSHVTAE